jgi:hypothetical protein
MGNVSIEAILKDIQINAEVANRDLTNWDPRTKPGMEAARNSANQKIADLEATYRDVLEEKIVPVFLTGDSTKCQTFANHANAKGYVTVNGQEHYAVIARNVDRTMAGSGRFDLAQVSEFNTCLREVAVDLNISSYNQVNVSGNYIGRGISNFDELQSVVSEIVRSTLGSDLTQIYLHKVVLNQAIQKRLAKGSFVVFIHGVVPSELNDIRAKMYGGRGFVVDVDNEIENKSDYDRLLKEFKQLTVEGDSN